MSTADRLEALAIAEETARTEFELYRDMSQAERAAAPSTYEKAKNAYEAASRAYTEAREATRTTSDPLCRVIGIGG
jgi:hypothetical protein